MERNSLEKISIHNRNLDARIEGIKSWKISKEDKKALPLFLKALERGQIHSGEKMSDSTLMKWCDMLKVALVFFNKDSEKLILKNIEDFDDALTRNKLKRENGQAYDENSKPRYKACLKEYLKWILKDEKKWTEMTGWLDCKTRINKTIPALKEEEVLKLFKACKNAKERFLVAVLFDSGARAEEFFNIRFEDIQKPSNETNFYRINLREEYSKTKGRNVSMLWSKSKEAIDDYLQERIAEGIKPTDAVFNDSYDAARFFLTRLGEKILKKHVHAHLLRHSSATYYADKLNRQQLCKRYGWTFSSRMPDVYIDRAGIDETEVENKFSNTELSAINTKLEKSEQEKNLLKEKMNETDKRIEELVKLGIVMRDMIVKKKTFKDTDVIKEMKAIDF
jgi:site-specific recombinase XerD